LRLALKNNSSITIKIIAKINVVKITIIKKKIKRSLKLKKIKTSLNLTRTRTRTRTTITKNKKLSKQ